MGYFKGIKQYATLHTTIILLLMLHSTACSPLSDLLTPVTVLKRVPRENKIDRYSSSQVNAQARPAQTSNPNIPTDRNVGGLNLEKRCARCELPYRDRGYDQRPYDNYYNDPRYDYDDRRYDDRDKLYGPGRYDRYDRDRYYDRDPYEARPTGGRGGYSGGRGDYYGGRDDYYERDPYDSRYRDPYYEGNDRGVGYDNRGYDHRTSYDRGGYDRENYRPYSGGAGYESRDRDYYSSGRRPQSYYGGSGYASGWSYGSGGRDEYYDRDRVSSGYGYGSQYRPRDPYDSNRAYLYGRPPSNTTDTPQNSSDGNNSATDSSSK